MDMNLSKQDIEEFEYELKQRLLEDEIEMRRMIDYKCSIWRNEIKRKTEKKKIKGE